MEGASTDEVAVDHAWLVDEDAAAYFQIELAFGHGGHAAILHAIRPGGNLHAVADAGNGSVFLEEIFGHARDPKKRVDFVSHRQNRETKFGEKLSTSILERSNVNPPI